MHFVGISSVFGAVCFYSCCVSSCDAIHQTGSGIELWVTAQGYSMNYPSRHRTKRVPGAIESKFVDFDFNKVLHGRGDSAKRMGDNFREVFASLESHLITIGNFQETRKICNAASNTKSEAFDRAHKAFGNDIEKWRRIEPTLTKINEFIWYFEEKKDGLSRMPKNRRTAILVEDDGFLKDLRETVRTPSRDCLQTFMHEIIDRRYAIPETADDEVAYAALDVMYSGVLSFISVLRYLQATNIYLMDHHYRNRDIDHFNSQVDHLMDDYESFLDALIGSRGLVDSGIRILKDVAKYNFARTGEGSPEELLKKAAFLEQERLLLENDSIAVPIILEDPGKLNAKLSFDSNSLATPIGRWRDGVKVRYAQQYVDADGLSKVGEWSEPITISGRANPSLRFPAQSTHARYIFRKFDDDKPQWVGVHEPARQEVFRDIDSDLFYVASGPDEKSAMADAEKYIAVGADAGTQFELGRRATHNAAIAGNSRLVSNLLLNLNSSTIHVKDNNGYTPLHLAAEYGWDDFVKLMMTVGSDINARTKDGSTALHLAVSNGYIDVARVILQHSSVDVNARGNNSAGPLHLAVLKSDVTLLSNLLTFDQTNVNIQTKFNLTPLHLAVLTNNTEITRILIADPRTKLNVKSYGNLTALHWAVISGNMPGLQMLVDLEATDMDPLSVNGWTPLHFAVATKQKDMVSALLKLRRLSVDIPGVGLITPLHIAVATDQREVFEDLASRGANIAFPNSSGLFPIDLAKINKSQKVLAAMKKMEDEFNSGKRQGLAVE